MPVPTGRTALLAAALAVGVAVFPTGPWPGLVFVNVLLLVIVAIDWFLAVSPNDLDVDRAVPGAVRAGTRAELSWRVTNRAGRAANVVLGDDIAPSLAPKSTTVRASVPAEGSATASTSIRPTRRGRFGMRGVAVRSLGPMRLVARQRFNLQPGAIRVHPAFPSEREAAVRAARVRMVESGVRPVRVAAGSREFDALRDYSPDDEFRRIDWAATARAGKPIVRTYRAERNQLLVVLVDSGRLMAGSVAGTPRLEHAMDAAMALTSAATTIGDRAGLVAFDDRVRRVVPASATRRQLTRVTEALYDLEPRLVETDYQAAIVETLARFPRRALVVLLTELPSASASELLAAAVPRVARHHLPVVASIRDPQLELLAHAAPDRASEVYRAAAAGGALDDRDRLASRLRAHGATVVDATPGRLASALVDVYVRVKTAGRL